MKKSILTFLQLLPLIISFVMIGAHFFRSGNLILTALCVAVPLSLFIQLPLPVRIVQGCLALAAAEWTRALFVFVSIRQAYDAPWMRLALILGAVACFTLASAFIFFSKTLKKRYKL